MTRFLDADLADPSVDGKSTGWNRLFQRPDNGIYWYVTVPTAHLLAFDATNLANQFYSSTTAANNRDALGSVVHFEMPVVANGKGVRER